MNLGEIASGINQDEFDGGSPSVSSISGWLSGNIGALNSVIFSDFSWSGDFPPEETSIFKAMYLCNFYQKESARAMRGLVTGSSSTSLLKVREGDSDISFVNRSEVAKSLRQVGRDYCDMAAQLIAAYNIYQAVPRQTAGEDQFYPIAYDGIPTNYPATGSY